MSLVSIISVNYNEPAVTIEFLKSIVKDNGIHSIEVILVDNGSLQNHEQDFKEAYPDLIYIRSKDNLGFAGGNNLGIQKAKGDYLFFLNNDTEITPTLITTLVTEMENNPAIGLISPLLLYYEDPQLIQYAGFSKMNYIVARNRTIGKLDRDKGQYDEISEETGFCHGAAMMCRKADLKEVGLMDENYFLYYEEMDWCEKFRRAGKKLWFSGKAKIYHKESISVGKDSSLKTYFLARNRMLFIRKNTSFINTMAFSIYFYGLVSPVLVLKYVKSGKKEHIKWIWRAMVWNLTQSTNSHYLGFEN